MTGFPTRDFVALVPVAILTVGAIALLLSEAFLVSGRRGYQAWLTVVIAAGPLIIGIARGKIDTSSPGRSCSSSGVVFVRERRAWSMLMEMMKMRMPPAI